MAKIKTRTFTSYETSFKKCQSFCHHFLHSIRNLRLYEPVPRCSMIMSLCFLKASNKSLKTLFIISTENKTDARVNSTICTSHELGDIEKVYYATRECST